MIGMTDVALLDWLGRTLHASEGQSREDSQELYRLIADRLRGEAAQSPSFDRRFNEMLIGILADVQDELGFTDEEKECSNGSAEILHAIRELKAAAPAPVAGDAVAGLPEKWRWRAAGYENPERARIERCAADLAAALAQDRASQAAAPSAPVGVE